MDHVSTLAAPLLIKYDKYSAEFGGVRLMTFAGFKYLMKSCPNVDYGDAELQRFFDAGLGSVTPSKTAKIDGDGFILSVMEAAVHSFSGGDHDTAYVKFVLRRLLPHLAQDASMKALLAAAEAISGTDSGPRSAPSRPQTPLPVKPTLPPAAADAEAAATPGGGSRGPPVVPVVPALPSLVAAAPAMLHAPGTQSQVPAHGTTPSPPSMGSPIVGGVDEDQGAGGKVPTLAELAELSSRSEDLSDGDGAAAAQGALHLSAPMPSLPTATMAPASPHAAILAPPPASSVGAAAAEGAMSASSPLGRAASDAFDKAAALISALSAASTAAAAPAPASLLSSAAAQQPIQSTAAAAASVEPTPEPTPPTPAAPAAIAAAAVEALTPGAMHSEAAVQASPQPAHPAEAEDDPALEEWEEFATPDGYLYYFCERTGVTQWLRPAAGIVLPLDDEEPGAEDAAQEQREQHPGRGSSQAGDVLLPASGDSSSIRGAGAGNGGSGVAARASTSSSAAAPSIPASSKAADPAAWRQTWTGVLGFGGSAAPAPGSRHPHSSAASTTSHEAREPRDPRMERFAQLAAAANAASESGSSLDQVHRHLGAHAPGSSTAYLGPARAGHASASTAGSRSEAAGRALDSQVIAFKEGYARRASLSSSGVLDGPAAAGRDERHDGHPELGTQPSRPAAPAPQSRAESVGGASTRGSAVAARMYPDVFSSLPSMDEKTADIMARAYAVASTKRMGYADARPDIRPPPLFRHNPLEQGATAVEYGGPGLQHKADAVWASGLRAHLYSSAADPHAPRSGSEMKRMWSSGGLAPSETMPGYAYRHAAATSAWDRSGTVYDRLVDVRGYTGAHRYRFDEEGRGRGLAGREGSYDYEYMVARVDTDPRHGAATLPSALDLGPAPPQRGKR